jgi:hypothetical protein
MSSLSRNDGCPSHDVVYHDASRFTFHGFYVMTPRENVRYCLNDKVFRQWFFHG